MSNMNIGAWPIEKTADLSNPNIECREATSNTDSELFWTKLFLLTSPYDEKRYRNITGNACRRIIQEESNKYALQSSASYRSSSVVAVSLSETSTKQKEKHNQYLTKKSYVTNRSRKSSAYTRFSCYLKSHNTNNCKEHTKKVQSRLLPKNNNYHYGSNKLNYLSSRRKPNNNIKNISNEKICQKCLKQYKPHSSCISSSLFCQICFRSMRNSTMNLRKMSCLNKSEENELRHMIEIIIEEFQDCFGQSLNLSIKQMTQHLLSNINLFYNHYQNEFEQLTKKYRTEFLERFIELMNKHQSYHTKPRHTSEKIRLTNSMTNPPDLLSMSSLSGSLTNDRDRSETICHEMTSSNSLSLSMTSNHSASFVKNNQNHRVNQNKSSKARGVSLIVTKREHSSSKAKKCVSSAMPRQLIDAYRFRDTLRMHNTQFFSQRPKFR